MKKHKKVPSTADIFLIPMDSSTVSASIYRNRCSELRRKLNGIQLAFDNEWEKLFPIENVAINIPNVSKAPAFQPGTVEKISTSEFIAENAEYTEANR